MRPLISFFSCYAAGLIGALFVTTGVGSWYASLAKPGFYPPTWTFAPVWLTLYGLMAIALTIIWRKDPAADEVRGWVPFFFAQLSLGGWILDCSA